MEDVLETRPPSFYRQSGVIPYRKLDERLEILLVTTRGNKGWTIPKGIIEPGLSATESAVQEAWEEAGIRGAISTAQVGEYRYAKWGGTCTVQVFLLRVGEQMEQWPEAGLRKRAWMSPREAAERVREETLRPLLARLPDMVGNWESERSCLLVDDFKKAEK
jgi:8-oxo-dGTP pyrophosphatase MutT (NUDIX family)